MNLNLSELSDAQLLDATRDQIRRSNDLDADLLLLLTEVEDRKLYAERAYSSMFAFCVGELGFSEDVACNRINLARAARGMPVILEAVRSGQVHLAGLRLLAPHLTAENQDRVLAEATGKSKREIEELVARLSPQPRLRARPRPLHVYRRAWPQVRRDWRPGIRSPRRLRANAGSPSGPHAPALPCAQPTCR